MNIAILSGALVSEVQTAMLSNGASLARFKLQTTDLISTEAGQRQQSTHHFIEVWSQSLQANVLPLLKIGDQIELQGSIETRTLERPNNAPQWMTAIVVRNDAHFFFGNVEANVALPEKAHDEAARHPSGFDVPSPPAADTAPVRACL